MEGSSPPASWSNEDCSRVLGSITVTSISVRGVPDVLLSERADGCAVGMSFSSQDSSFDDESSESGDGGRLAESGSSAWARFAFAGAYRADNMPSTTLRNFNGWGTFGGLESGGAWT